MGKICPKNVELILEINKTVIVASRWFLYYLTYIDGVRSNTNQIKFVVISEIKTINSTLEIFFFLPCATQPIVGVYFTAFYRALASSRTRLLDHTERRATFGRTPLNE